MRRAAWRAVPAAGSHGPVDGATPSPHAAPRSAPVNLWRGAPETLNKRVAVDVKIASVTYTEEIPARRLRELAEGVDGTPRGLRDQVFEAVLREIYPPRLSWRWRRSPVERFRTLDPDRRTALIERFLAALADAEPMPVCPDTP